MQELSDGLRRPLRGPSVPPLRNRADAGQKLAKHLVAYKGRSDLIVLGLPRGGVPVAYEIAKVLHAPLDIFVVRKLGVPGNEELAMGALAAGGVRVLNEDVVRGFALSEAAIERVASAERHEIERRERTYRGDRPRLDIRGKTVILVDDGIATGATLRAAIVALRAQVPAKLIVAVGVAPPETCELLAEEVDELICLLKPSQFWSVGVWFEDFDPTSDQEVQHLLAQATPIPPER